LSIDLFVFLPKLY